MNDKVRTHHLQRNAYIYIRQSTAGQVANNLESQRLQYNLVERAMQLGWAQSQIKVIDQDLGHSASGAHLRSGFEQLLQDVCAAQVGAIFSVDASRLARNGREWHTLLELCCVVDTLLIDPQTLYNPQSGDDRLLLGLKGEFSEMELRTLRERSQAPIKEKAQRGELHRMLSAGYLKTNDNQLIKNPDLRVQQAIELVFIKFRELGSIRQTCHWFIEQQVELPVSVCQKGPQELHWRLPSVSTLGYLLKNPVYAGAYAYGRTKNLVKIENGRKKINPGVVLPQKDWDVLILDHHCGYICWEEYQHNQAMITQNANRQRPAVIGSAGAGRALLAGLLRCGHCGCKISTRYVGNPASNSFYWCGGYTTPRGWASLVQFWRTQS